MGPIPSKDATTTTQTLSARSAGPAIETRLARLLQQSSQRRVLSTLVDWRDWPSYIYMVLAFVLLFFLPLQVYQLYRKSQMQADIIKSIAAGDPDIHQILELGTSDPTANWVGEEILDKTAVARGQLRRCGNTQPQSNLRSSSLASRRGVTRSPGTRLRS